MSKRRTNQQRDNYSRNKRMAVRFRLIGAVPLDIRDLGRYLRYQRSRLCRVNSGHFTRLTSELVVKDFLFV